jgi:predicted molibdopterin-dependent oxidoreductase YjgC
VVQRLKPRTNLDVNAFWMCDYGRLSYEWINRPDRIDAPWAREGTARRATGWKDALLGVLARLGEGSVRAVVSARLSNEDLAAARALVDQLGGGEIVYRSARAPDEVPLKGFPTLVRRRDLAPNVNGAQLLGMKRVGDDDGTGGLDQIASHTGVILVIGDDLDDQVATFGDRAALYVYMGTHAPDAAAAAHFVLPITTFAEQEGTFTNHENRVQRFWPAIEPPGSARPAWLVLGAMLAERTGRTPPTRAEAAFESIPAFRGLTYETIGTRGAVTGSIRRETAGAAGDD